jgi:hypothetical protein
LAYPIGGERGISFVLRDDRLWLNDNVCWEYNQ